MPGKMVSQPPRRANGSTPLPSLAEVQRDPTRLDALSVTAIVALRRQVSHLAADLDAAFYYALAQSGRQDQRAETPSDRLLTPEAAAARFGVTKRWLLEHADHIAGVRRLSRKIVRFSERHLERFFNRPSV
jgi:hypothetical protein